MIMLKILKKFILYIAGSIFLVLRLLLSFIVHVAKIAKFILFPKARNRVRYIVVGTFLVIFLLGSLSYPNYWNSFADWINPKLDAVDVPSSIEQFDKWGVFRTLDEKIFVKHFWDVPFSLGLDLAGGTRLIYEGDRTILGESDNAEEAMEGLRDVVEQRVNVFGVREPLVYVEKSGDSRRLVVELAGVHDTSAAISIIGETPRLEFKEERTDAERKEILEGARGVIQILDDETIAKRASLCKNSQFIFFFITSTGRDPCFKDTGLTGALLERADVGFGGGPGSPSNEPIVNITFNSEGTALFEEITERNIGKPLAIYLDDVLQSTPTVQQKITGGSAQISGKFTLEEVQHTVRYLNAGALPIPITLISQQTVGATLGEASINASITAGLWGVILVMLFLVLLYRFSGLISVVALLFYAVVLLAIIKLIPITLTLPGIAGLILSLGMAVDANILIFERLREELRNKDIPLAISVDRAFARAWTSIRDGNISTLITAVILFFFTTSFIQGFALTLGIGIATSMFSAMIVTKYLLKWFIGKSVLAKHSRIWSR